MFNIKPIKLSIIIPVYNTERFINKCIDSLLNQTLTDIEIICVNDCSPDNSGVILDSYAKCYPELIKVIHLKENMRQGGARNYGLDVAQGEYIGFLDSDDWVHKDMYQSLFNFANENNLDAADSGLIATNGTKELYREKKSPEIVTDKAIMIEKFGRLVTKIYKREIFENKKVRFLEKSFYEDNYILPFLVNEITTLGRMDEEYYYYYYNDESTTKKPSPHYFERMTSANKMIDDFDTTNFNSSERAALMKKYFYYHSIGTVFNALGMFYKLPSSVIRELRKSDKKINGRINVFRLFGFNKRTVIYFSVVTFPPIYQLIDIFYRSIKNINK
jgi:glycosyltransferase involved in cell wall biosynthesis